MKTLVSHSLEETQKVAHDFLEEISNSHLNSSEALLIGLSGHLGAGKTAFVKAIAKELGIKEEVTSPTFVIMKIYEIGNRLNSFESKESVPAIRNFSWKRLIHIDAYRLERPEELEVLNFEKIVADPHNLIFVEWPENVGLEKFGEKIRLSFEIKDDAHMITQ